MSELNQETKEDNQESNTEEKSPESTLVSSNDSSQEVKYQSLKQEFNQSLNGVVLKLEKKFQSELQTILEEMKKPKEENKVTLETDKEESNDDTGLTIQTLKAEYEAKAKELEEKFAASEAERLRDKKNTFLAGVKFQVVRRFARLGFDDIESATEVFYSMHSEDNFIQGDGGTILYRIGEDQYSSLDMLTEEWKKGKIGKRFLKVNQPKGASLDEPIKQPKPSSTDTKKRLTLRQIDEGINNGSIKVKY